jgi:Transmembrane secretion effector
MGATTNTIIQLTVPDDLRGRVMSVYTTVFAGTTPIGSLLAGGLASVLGVGPTLVLAGVVTAASTAVAALWATRRRRLALWTPPSVAAAGPGPSSP